MEGASVEFVAFFLIRAGGIPATLIVQEICAAEVSVLSPFERIPATYALRRAAAQEGLATGGHYAFLK